MFSVSFGHRVGIQEEAEAPLHIPRLCTWGSAHSGCFHVNLPFAGLTFLSLGVRWLGEGL